MKKSSKRILIIVLSIMIIMTYMIPGSVFADTAGTSDETTVSEVHEHDPANEELSEGDDGAGAISTDAEEGSAEEPAEEAGEVTEEVSEPAEAEETTEEVTEEPAEELPVVEETVTVNEEAKAAAGGLSVLAFTSDTHNTSGNSAANRLGTWLDKMADIYGAVDVMAFGGDMAGAGASGYWDLTQADMNKVSERGITPVYTTGNHEISYGGDFSYSTYTSGGYSKTETKGQFEINKEVVNGSNYRVYALGSTSSSSTYANSTSALRSYLNSVGSDKPIFIITHFPLHYYSGRTTTSAADVIDILNDAVNNNKQKIVFLWGHNHTMSDTYYDYIYRPGDKIPTSSSSSQKEINFYYGAAGCMSDGDYGTGSGYVKGKGLLVTVNSKNQLSFTYYNANGTDVSEGGTFTEQDPVAVTGVTVTPATATVLERKTVQLTAEVLPADATTRGVTWSSSNTSVATVDNKGLVKGVSEGTAVITAKTVDGNFTASSTVTVQHNDDPSVEETIDITPSTDNPEQSISINVGDTLTVNVTNGSSNSTYTFTATLSKNGVAQNLGESSVSIAAGAKGQFTFEGVADGTVDITIQNSNTYGSQYTRKGVIHLTVGEGGSTPVDPPTGDTVSITPSTDNPEQSIKIAVGDTLTINVTNGSSNSAYDFTATLSNSGVAQLQNSTVNIAAGATGQFTVTGLKDGTVDITIQNSNTYGSQYTRKGVIHLTVGEGGSTPVDPPTGDTVSITPSTDKPEESIKIAVGDTLTINVTNGSSNSAYDFTATLSNSGVAQLQNSSVNIAAGGTGQFTVKGLAEGTVDITIRNNNTQYGADYERIGTIHLTVGEGGTPVDPPVGDTVTYQLTDSLEGGNDYIIANGNTGSVYVVSNQANGSRTLKGISATVSGDLITLSASDAAKAAFTAEAKTSVSGSDSVWLKNGSQYLYTNNSNGLRVSSDQTATDNTGKYWHYKADGKNLLWYFKDTNDSDGYTDTSGTYKYYLECSNGNFTDNHVTSPSLENSDLPKIYLFKKYEGPMEVTGVSLNKTALTLKTGQNETLTATVVPSGAANKEVTWSTSNASVATVDSNGKVTAVAAGTATITVTTVENSKKATCTVTVKDPGEGQTYVLTDTLEADKEYLIANGKTGSVYILSNEANGSKKLKGISAEVIGETITIDEETEAKAVFTAEGKGSAGGTVSVWFKNGGQYLYADSSNGLRLVGSDTQASSSNSNKVWHYKADNKNLLWFFNSNSADGYTDTSQTYKYFLEVSGSDFTDNHASTTSLANTNTPAMYLYVKDEGTPQPHTHTYGQPVWAWSSDNSSATATFTCAECGDVQIVAATVTTKAESDGSTTYTATATFEGKTYTDTKSSGHQHSMTATAAKAATCTENGNIAYWYCAGCGKYFSDADGNNQIAVGGWVLPAIGHDLIGHAAQAPTCEAIGWDAYFTCSRCDYTTYVEKPALGHDWTEVTYQWSADNTSATASRYCRNDVTHFQTEPGTVTAEVITAPTCETAGKTTYTATFKNTAFATITKTVETEALGHDWDTATYSWAEDNSSVTASHVCKRDASHKDSETVQTTVTVVKAATCTETGETAYKADFTKDGFSEQNRTIQTDMIPHTLTHHAAKAEECEKAGNTEYWSCDVCKKLFEDAEGKTEIAPSAVVIPATGHAPVADAAKAPTCDETGLTEGSHCAICGKILKAQEVVPALGHDWAKATYQWAEDYSTVTAERVCTRDASHVEKETVETKAEVIKEGSCTEDGHVKYTATFTKEGFDEQSREVITKATGHKWDAGKVTKEPTYRTDGEMTYTCTVCGATYTEPIPKQGWKRDSDNNWNYINPDGSKATGWKQVGDYWYYMDKAGVMQTGWTKVGNKWYYMNKNGAMQTGWQKIGGKWYYFASSGAMQTGWQEINGKTYYFKSSGVMADKEWVSGYWWINSGGTWTYKYRASWEKTADGHWMFKATNGWTAKSTTIIINDVSYTFDANGYMI